MPVKVKNVSKTGILFGSVHIGVGEVKEFEVLSDILKGSIKQGDLELVEEPKKQPEQSKPQPRVESADVATKPAEEPKKKDEPKPVKDTKDVVGKGKQFRVG